jgi:hypothetical protein
MAKQFGTLRQKITLRREDKILYVMIISSMALLAILPHNAFSQKVQLSKLEIPQGASYNLEADTVLVDELVLKDSCKVNLVKPHTYIKANRTVIGVACSILGVGKDGESGKDGKSPPAPIGLCKAPVNAGAGGAGKNGEAGKNFSLSTVSIKIASTVTIDIHGGGGGDGGKGGNGSHGSNTTPHCKGDGGNGGNGGSGGNGGNGGVLAIYYTSATELSYFVTKVNLVNRGGYRGIGGNGGKGGMRGSGPSEKISKIGVIGREGAEGKYGTDGRPLFFSLIKSDANTESKASSANKGN